MLKKDNGRKFVSKEFENYLKIHGIQHQKFVPYSPQQNGVAEQMN
jgi:transposase InsO family protein